MLSCFVCFLAVLLLLTGMFFVFYLVFSSGSTNSDGFFIAVEGEEDNKLLAEQVYAAYIQINLMNFKEKRPVYVIDRNLSEKTRDELTKAVEPYGKIVFIDMPKDFNVLQ